MSGPLKFRILVVDDEECIRELFWQLLQREGYEVATAEDGFDALLTLKQFLPDVIISDLNMPKMSGFEFLSVVRRRFPKISVIASSGAYGSRVVPTGVLADASIRLVPAHSLTRTASSRCAVRPVTLRRPKEELITSMATFSDAIPAELITPD
jgi:CheY-like chemotaxis protein